MEILNDNHDPQLTQPFLPADPQNTHHNIIIHAPAPNSSSSPHENTSLTIKVWQESKKLWHIVGPATISRVSAGTMNVISQSFAGHIGGLELASITIANNVIVGFNFGLLLGMASALETLCGQAFGANKHNMLGTYLQRSWIVLFLCCFFLLPFYAFATPILKLLGQPDDVAEQSGTVSLWLIPLHFSFAFQLPIQRFLQSQLKTGILVWVPLINMVIHVLLNWILVTKFQLGVIGVALALDISWWLLVLALFMYVACGGCPQTWTGFSIHAFYGLLEFLKLSASSAVMLCLENWYYRILIVMTGFFNDAKLALDALAICVAINGWELMFALSFFVGIGVRVANELGAGNGQAAKFATKVCVVQSSILGVFFFIIVLVLRGKLALMFSTDADIIEAVDEFSFVLALSILFNSVQPVLSGVAVGSGWQTWVAWINIICYYLVGFPVGIVLGWIFHLGTMGIWTGMIIGGTGLQTLILAWITVGTNWEVQVENATKRVEKWSV